MYYLLLGSILTEFDLSFTFMKAISSSKELGSDTNGSAVCISESSTGFMSYTVQIISTCSNWILQQLQFSLLPLI